MWTLGPVAVGLAFDRFGGYTVPFWTLVGVSAAACAILMAERQALAAREAGPAVAVTS